MSTQTPPPQVPSNPFASRYVRPGAIAFRASTTTSPSLDSIVSRLREFRCGAIVGNHGTGKSTLLRELAATLQHTMPGGQWVQLTQDVMSPASGWLHQRLHQTRAVVTNIRTVLCVQRRVTSGGVLVIDGAEQLPAVCRWLIAVNCRRAGHFCLLTSHHDIAGFETLYRTALSAELIEALLTDLLSPCDHVTNVTLPVHLRQHIATIDLTSVTNLRDLWDELYEVVERNANLDE